MIDLLKKYKELLLYLIFGVVTTVTNIALFQLLRRIGVDLFLSNLIAWIGSVTVAYVTNKLFVFESTGFDVNILLREGVLFFGARLLSLGIDMVAIALLVNVLHIAELFAKVFSNGIVIIVNYILSKLVIFKK